MSEYIGTSWRINKDPETRPASCKHFPIVQAVATNSRQPRFWVHEVKGGSSGMFWREPNDVWRGQMVFQEGPNCPKKSILSMQRHRHNVKTLHGLEVPNHGFGTIGGWTRYPPPLLDRPMHAVKLYLPYITATQQTGHNKIQPRGKQGPKQLKHRAEGIDISHNHQSSGRPSMGETSL